MPSALEARPDLLAQPLWLAAALLACALLAAVLGGLWWRQLRLARKLRRRLAAAEKEATTLQRAEGEDSEVPGLMSRPRFDAALDKATRRADAQPGASVVVLFVNLDNFRSVNDIHGYEAGDLLIRAAARRLLACAGTGAKAARLNVDEFLLLFDGGIDAACELALRLRAALAREYDLGGRGRMALGCSIGLAAYPQHGPSSQLVGHAGTAMQVAKRSGGNEHMVFDPQMAADLREYNELLADLRQALSRGQLELYYQPKVDARTLKVNAAEALLRWHHPKRGLVSPGLFVPMAERAGLIGPIGNWVIEDACRQAAVWRDEGLRMRVAINLSAYQMRQDDLIDRLVDALQRHRLQPGRFTVEITESVAMEDTQVTQRSFARLRKAGIHVSIDDFGVGQASLSYLRRLPAAELKVDASFVREIATSDQARTIVEAVVRMAHALGLKVVAEGVETEAQCERLVALGCDELQGYLFARPMPAKTLGTWAQLDVNEPGRMQRFSGSLFMDTRPQE